MDLKTLFLVFGTVFIAELGDKTQLATMLYATDKEVNKLIVFLGSSLALVCTSALGVLLGHLISKTFNTKYLTLAAGVLFVLVGCVTIYKGAKAG